MLFLALAYILPKLFRGARPVYHTTKGSLLIKFVGLPELNVRELIGRYLSIVLSLLTTRGRERTFLNPPSTTSNRAARTAMWTGWRNPVRRRVSKRERHPKL